MDEQRSLGNGESDKMVSVKIEEMDSTSADNGEQAKLEKGAKRKSKGGGPSPKKKRVLPAAVQQKNPLMQLNELKPGLTYKVESQSGPPHNPEFVVSVDVNGQKYIGRGNSKQLAKHAAAQAALASIVQFRNTPGPMTMMNVDPNAMVDFTKDNVENEGCNFNKFEVHKNGDEEEVLISTGAPALKPHPLKILNEADKKNPIMLLNEIHPGLEYQLKEENSTIPSQRFRIIVEVNGETYEGTGQSKKLAKTAAARAVLCQLYNVSYSMYKDVFAQSTSDADLFSFPQAVADKISNQLMSTFTDVMVGIQDYAKWKVIAGIAMTKDESMEDSQIISFGTGTKCISGEHISMVGANINDCHAEIISRRCLKDFFYTNLELLIEGEGDESIFEKRDGGGFRLKPHIKFHLYISTAPCGDARIFAPHEECIGDAVDRHPNRNSRGVLRTKIESGEGTIPVKGGQCIQTWDSILPGQERLLTMSCSDKIASWNVLGLQGALLSHFVEPIYLDSIILGGLFHPNHLRRALFGRIENHLKDLPEHFRINKPKMCSTTSSVVRHVSKSPSFSVNWTLGLGRAEVVNAMNGKTEGGQVSRLSKRSFFQRFINIYDKLSHIDTHATPKPPLYGVFKSAMESYKEAQKSLTAAFVAAGLGHWVKKPIEQNEFEVA